MWSARWPHANRDVPSLGPDLASRRIFRRTSSNVAAPSTMFCAGAASAPSTRPWPIPSCTGAIATLRPPAIALVNAQQQSSTRAGMTSTLQQVHDGRTRCVLIGAGHLRHPMGVELQLRSCIKNFRMLRHRAKQRFVHVDHHPWDDQPGNAFTPIGLLRLRPHWICRPPSGSRHVGKDSNLKELHSASKRQLNQCAAQCSFPIANGPTNGR